MKKEDIVPGKTYRIRQWDDMAKEFGVKKEGGEGERIEPEDAATYFPVKCCSLCGKYYTPASIGNDGCMEPGIDEYDFLVEAYMLEPLNAGMYEVANPSYPQVKVGQFTICRQDDTSVWICNDEGEGAQFRDELFETAILEFFNKYF